MARRPRRPAGGDRKPFDEKKVRRSEGRFAEKPAASQPATPPPSREGQLKKSEVSADDEIIDLRDGKGRSLGTVSEFVRKHSGGSDTALRTLLREYREGRIGFRARKPPTPRLVERLAWPGRAEPRDISRDKIRINRSVLESGLFRDEAHARNVTAALLAGTPPEERLRVHWRRDPHDGTVTMEATSGGDDETVDVQRDFRPHFGGGWEVDHAYFAVPTHYQGRGGAARMMRASVEAYDALGVNRIDVHAALTVGGHAWAKMGFVVNDAAPLRGAVAAALKSDPASPILRAAKRVTDTSADDEVMFNLARLTGPDGEPWGKRLLVKTSWYGHINLTDARHRARVASNFSE